MVIFTIFILQVNQVFISVIYMYKMHYLSDHSNTSWTLHNFTNRLRCFSIYIMQGDTNRRPVDDVVSQSHHNRDYLDNRLGKHKKHWVRWTVVVLVILLGAAIIYYFIQKNGDNNTLPYPISQQTAGLLGFDIYYPNQKLLPQGYTLNKNSFSDNDQAIIYTVSYGNNQKIVFSDQAKPSTDDLETFVAKNMPLSATYQTAVGKATIGAINAQSVVSLPTNTNAWLIITAPGNINQNQLNQLLNSIELAK